MCRESSGETRMSGMQCSSKKTSLPSMLTAYRTQRYVDIVVRWYILNFINIGLYSGLYYFCASFTYKRHKLLTDG